MTYNKLSYRKTGGSIDTSTIGESDNSSSMQNHREGNSSYNRLLNPSEVEESNGQEVNGRQTKPTVNTTQCNHSTTANPTTVYNEATPPSTAEDGPLSAMHPRDADVLQSAVASSFCCPVCGCLAIASAKKARRLRQTGKYCSSAQASHLSSRWAVRAVFWGCFLFLGLLISVIIFLITRYIY